MQERLLTVENLHTEFIIAGRTISAVSGVSFHVNRRETLGIVGESGCGKSVTSLSIMRLIPSPPGRISSGKILLEEKDILELPEVKMRDVRGKEISMVFQEPATSLNPVFTIGEQITEIIRQHHKLNKKAAYSKAAEMLQFVGIASPERRIREYPHQLSGGMKQRVMIAIALCCSPKLLIADEPTTALDVTIQAQVLELMKRLKGEMDMAIILISHDLGVIAEMAERVVVMYAGVIVEESPVEALFEQPIHPYTRGLLTSIPHLDRGKGRLNVIKGTVPNPLNFPSGCRFHPRCPYTDKQCKKSKPSLVDIGNDRKVNCWKYREFQTSGGIKLWQQKNLTF